MTSPKEPQARRGRPHVVRRLLLSFVSPNSYGMVLALIVTTYVIAVAAPASWVPFVVFVQVTTVWFALRTSRAARVVRIVADVALVAATLFALFEIARGLPEEPSARVFAVSALLYLIAPIAAIRHIATRPAVDQETLLGAIGAYLMIGMCFAFTYRVIALLSEGPFFGPAGEGTMEQVLFFSFTTLTTTGFGNYVPADNPGQTLAVAEMLIGQLFLIIAVGKVIATWRPSRRSAQQEAAATDTPQEAGPGP